jgi:hypothetical protein
VVDGQVGQTPATVLTGKVIPSKHFSAGQFDPHTRPDYHLLQPDDGWQGVRARDSFHLSAAVYNQRGLVGENQSDCTPGIADVDRFEVGV